MVKYAAVSAARFYLRERDGEGWEVRMIGMAGMGWS